MKYGNFALIAVMASLSALGDGLVSNASPYTPETATEPVERKPEGGPYTELVGGVEWKFVVDANLEACVYDGSGSGSAVPRDIKGGVEIPSMLGGRPVTCIGRNALSQCFDLTSVTIPKGVKTIDNYAFYFCTGLDSLTIPSGVTVVGDYAFVACIQLTSIALPEGLSSIGVSAFSMCKGLASVVIPEGVTNVGANAFSGCAGIKSLTFPSSLESIGSSAFNGCEMIEAVHISDLAAWCNVDFGDSWSRPNYAHKLYLGDNEIIDLEIPEGVTTIKDYAFRDSSGLMSVNIPSGVSRIGSVAFSGCKGLKTVTIPATVTTFGSSAFGGCDNLATIYVDFGDVDRVRGKLYEMGLPVSQVQIKEKAYEVDLNDGTGVLETKHIRWGGAIGELPIPMRFGFEFLGWFTDVSDGEEIDASYIPTGDMTVYAHWCQETQTDGGPYSLEIDGTTWTYVIKNGEAVIGGGERWYPAVSEPTVGEIAIPSTLGNCPVTGIGNFAFSECSWLTSVTIPEGVTSIGECAFSDCIGLLSVVMPSTLVSIGGNAFSECYALTSVTLPPTVISIGELAFKGCPGLQDEDGFVIRNGILFGYYGPLTVVEIPQCVSSIGGFAFSDNSAITSVTMPSGVISIGWAAFSGCSKLSTVAMPSSLTSIGGYAFNNCTGLNSITIPSGVTSLGYGAFMGCGGLETLAIPASVTSVDSYAFYNCTELAAITVPSSVTSIGRNAFLECGKLTTFYVDKGDADRVRVMVSGTGFPTDELTFTEAAYKVEFQFGEEELFETKYVRWGDAIGELPIPSRAGYEFTGWFTDAVEGVKIDESYIPASDTTVYARWVVISQPDGGPYEQEVDGVVWKYTVSKGAAIIGWGTRTTDTAVPGTTAGAITIPSSLGNCPVTRIGEHAFYGCNGITALTVPEGVTSIGAYAFADCSGLISATIPSSVTSIDDYVIDGSEALKEIKVSVDNMNYLSYDGVLYDKDCTTLITCPKGKNSVAIIDGVSCIATRAFRSCKKLISVEVPDSVAEIRGSAFKGCTALTAITIPCGVVEIGESAFEQCSSLTSVDIPSSVVKIDYAAFSSCENLAEVKFHEGLEIIGDAFWGCAKLSSFTIPNSVLSVTTFSGTKRYKDCSSSAVDYIIMDNCLMGLTPTAYVNLKDLEIPNGVRVIASVSAYGKSPDDGKFETVTLPDTVRVIGSGVFASSKVKSISIPTNSVKIIGSGAFRRSKLVDVNIPEGVESIGDEAFYECENLKTVTIAGSVKSIGAWCFAYSRYVQSLSMGEGVEKIGASAFFEMGYQWVYWNSSNSVKIDIPSTIKEIGASAFSRTGYKNVAVNLADVATWCEAKFSNRESVPWYYRYGGKIDHLVYPDLKIPYGPTKISSYAFADWKCFGLIELPPSVRRIESNAFYQSKMESIKIPSNVTEIEKGAFDYCTNLKTIYVSENDAARVKEMMRGMLMVDVDELEFIEVPAVEFGTAESVAEVFGEGSAMAECVKDPTQLAAFNTFLSDCGITSVESITAAQKQYAYQSFRLSEITTAPQLFEEEPLLKIDDVELSGGNLSLTISLTAGAEAIQLAKDRLAEKIRVGTTLGDITGKPNITAHPGADGTSLTFTITPPEGDRGFVKVQID